MVKRLYVWAGEEELLTVNPAKSVRATGTEVIRDRVLENNEIVLIMRAADVVGGANGALIKVLALTGQRRGEVAGMRWADLDLDYRLRVGVGEAEREIVCPIWRLSAEQTKPKRAHLVPLPPLALAIINAQPRVDECEFVFTNDHRHQISGFSKIKIKLDEEIAKQQEVNGQPKPIDEWRFHDLRRTCASWSGFSPRARTGYLGRIESRARWRDRPCIHSDGPA